MGGAFSIAQGGRGPGGPGAAATFLLAPGRMCASWAGLVLFAGVIAVNQSRFSGYTASLLRCDCKFVNFRKGHQVFFKHYFVFYH